MGEIRFSTGYYKVMISIAAHRQATNATTTTTGSAPAAARVPAAAPETATRNTDAIEANASAKKTDHSRSPQDRGPRRTSPDRS